MMFGRELFNLKLLLIQVNPQLHPMYISLANDNVELCEEKYSVLHVFRVMRSGCSDARQFGNKTLDRGQGETIQEPGRKRWTNPFWTI